MFTAIPAKVSIHRSQAKRFRSLAMADQMVIRPTMATDAPQAKFPVHQSCLDINHFFSRLKLWPTRITTLFSKEFSMSETHISIKNDGSGNAIVFHNPDSSNGSGSVLTPNAGSAIVVSGGTVKGRLNPSTVINNPDRGGA
jgi:hypothetical protein